MRNIIIRGCKKLEKYTVDKIAVTIENCFDVILSSVHIYMEDKDILNTYSLLGINVLGKSKFVNFSCNKIILYYHEMQVRNINNTLLIDHFQQVEYVNTFLTIDLKIYHHLYEITIQLAHVTLQNQNEFLYGVLSNSILYVIDCQFSANHFPLFNIKVAINNDYSSIKFINCKFLNNPNLTPLINSDVNVTIINCIFNGSSVILQSQLPRDESYKSTTTALIIKNTQFINCKYSKLNSLIHTWHVDIIIVNCTFNGNSNILQLRGNGSYKKTTAVIENTQFNNNYLNNPNQESLINIWYADVTIVNCSFNTNLDSILHVKLHGYKKIKDKGMVTIKNTQFVNSVFKYYKNLIILSDSGLLLEGVITFHAITNHDSIIALNDNSTIIIHGSVKFSNNIGHQLISFINNINQYIKLKEPSIISIHHNQVCSSFVVLPRAGTLYQFCIFQYYTNKTHENEIFLIEYFNNQYKCNLSECNCYNYHLPIVNCHWLPQSAFYHMIPLDVNNQFIKYINNSDAIKANNDQNTLCACNNQMNYDCSINDLGYLYPGETLNIILYHKDNGSNHHSTKIIAKNDINVLDSRPCIVSSFVEVSQAITNNYCSKVTYTTLTFWFGDWCELFLKVELSPDDYNKRFYVRKLSCPAGFIEINKTCQCDPIIVNYGITKCNINNQTVLRTPNTWITATTYIPYSYNFSQQCRFYYCLPHSSNLNFSTPDSQCQFNRTGLLCGHCQQGLSATLIIITSRYSTTIQRLTARRALPVLATLFLLSYTKILRIVCSVLFFYSTITHLPSKHTTLVWSVDANVPLFGVRFTILFIVCLILFLTLVPFNVILLFTRTLSRFKAINRFKPILDAYQGPYKDRFYYWTGLQLVVRAVLLAVSSLDRNNNLTICIIIFGILGGIQGVLQPLKSKIQNYQELLFIFYLQGSYTIALSSQDITDMTVINIIIIMVMMQFSFILTYHIISYVCGVHDLSKKIVTGVNSFRNWITKSCSKPRGQQFQLHDNIQDNIPEVAFNCHEYREPLIGED